MIKIEALLENETFTPAEAIPEGTARIIFDGTHYCCYTPKEAEEIAQREAKAAEEAQAQQEAAEAATTTRAEEEKQQQFNDAVAQAVAAALAKAGVTHG